jgi:hypothetical protein
VLPATVAASRLPVAIQLVVMLMLTPMPVRAYEAGLAGPLHFDCQ